MERQADTEQDAGDAEGEEDEEDGEDGGDADDERWISRSIRGRREGAVGRGGENG